jgi:hypothetical protein
VVCCRSQWSEQALFGDVVRSDKVADVEVGKEGCGELELRARKKVGRRSVTAASVWRSVRKNCGAEDQSHFRKCFSMNSFHSKQAVAMAARRACMALPTRAFRLILQPYRHRSSSTSAMAYKAIHRRIAPLPTADTRPSSPNLNSSTPICLHPSSSVVCSSGCVQHSIRNTLAQPEPAEKTCP